MVVTSPRRLGSPGRLQVLASTLLVLLVLATTWLFAFLHGWHGLRGGSTATDTAAIVSAGRALARDPSSTPLPPPSTLSLYEEDVTYHPSCSYQHKPSHIQDFTAQIRSHPDLHKACISNPSVVALQPAAMQPWAPSAQKPTHSSPQSEGHAAPASMGQVEYPGEGPASNSSAGLEPGPRGQGQQTPDTFGDQLPQGLEHVGSAAGPEPESEGAPIPSPGLMVLAYRIYTSTWGHPCTVPEEEGGQWKEGWKGSGGLGLAVVRWPDREGGKVHVLLQWHEMPSSREDARLFRDDQGKIRLLYNRWRGGDPSMRGFKRFQRRSMHVVQVHIDGDSSGDGSGLTGIRLENEQELLYLGQQRDEKNWVPWEGSTRMTYPQYPGFEPHIVLDWHTYDLPEDQLRFASKEPLDVMRQIRGARGNWFRFSGGTPSVRLDEDRYLAVGHTVGDISCYHSPLWWKGSMDHLLKQPQNQPQKQGGTEGGNASQGQTQPQGGKVNVQPPVQSGSMTTFSTGQEAKAGPRATQVGKDTPGLRGSRAVARALKQLASQPTSSAAPGHDGVEGGSGSRSDAPGGTSTSTSIRGEDGGGDSSGDGDGASTGSGTVNNSTGSSQGEARGAAHVNASVTQGEGAKGKRQRVLPEPWLTPHWCNSSYPAPTDEWAWRDHFWKVHHWIPVHHGYWEYFFFLYTFSAHPPHQITHLSHAFIPWDKPEHRGVYFPTGLERLPAQPPTPSARDVNSEEGADDTAYDTAPGAGGADSGNPFLLTYGNADFKLMSMLLGPELLREWLVPVEAWKPEEYQFCAVH